MDRTGPMDWAGFSKMPAHHSSLLTMRAKIIVVTDGKIQTDGSKATTQDKQSDPGSAQCMQVLVA